MKTKLSLLILLGVLTTSVLSAKPPKQGKLTVSWSFLHIVEGYDHDTKCIVFVDGKQVGESSVKKESEKNSITVATAQGSHEVKVVNYAFYEGKWEEHTIDNTYSIDCKFEQNITIKKKTKITLVFDIDKGTESKIK